MSFPIDLFHLSWHFHYKSVPVSDNYYFGSLDNVAPYFFSYIGVFTDSLRSGIIIEACHRALYMFLITRYV